MCLKQERAIDMSNPLDKYFKRARPIGAIGGKSVRILLLRGTL